MTLHRISYSDLFSGFLILIAISFFLVSCGPEQVEEHDSQGNLTASYQVKDTIKHGQYTSYHANGKVFEQATYVDGQLHGLRTLYYEDGKSQQIEETYKHGKMEGIYRSFHKNGTIAFTGSYVDEAMDGLWKKYNESGKIIEEVSFKENEENGPFKEYYLNGQVSIEGNYLNGDSEHGTLKFYNELGELEKEMDCNNGICRTIWPKDTSK